MKVVISEVLTFILEYFYDMWINKIRAVIMKNVKSNFTKEIIVDNIIFIYSEELDYVLLFR